MAINYKSIKEKLEKDPFSETELKWIDMAETHIDNKIRNYFDGGSVEIELEIPSFSCSPTNGRIEIRDVRKALMQKELEKRYRMAGWKIKIEYGDDNGHRPGQDYWVLTGLK